MDFWYVYKEIKHRKGHTACSLQLFSLADFASSPLMEGHMNESLENSADLFP